MKDKDTLLLEEAYDEVTNKTKIIDTFIRRLMFDIRDRNRWVDWDDINLIQSKLKQFYNKPEFKEHIDTKLKEYGISNAIIFDLPTPEDLHTIDRMDFSAPIL